ncbi:MAG: hypothetical protein LAT84_14495 [Balneolia bacterium]|nr:hypothetical protein [Balneolia bacterium]
MIRSILAIGLLFFALFMLSSCAAEHPGEAQTTGVQQFLGNGFSFKHPDNGRLDLRGENDWARRTMTVRGPELQLIAEAAEEAITLPAFEYFVEVFDNPERLDGRAFAREKINNAAEQGDSGNLWPINAETGQLDGRNVRVRGMEAFETRFPADYGYTVRTFVASGDVALAIGYRELPAGMNPINDAWRGTWRMALDSVRMD